MDVATKLEAALSRPDAAFVCLPEHANACIDPPPGLDTGDAEFIAASSPLELFSVDDYGPIGVAFQQALKDGFCSTRASLADGAGERTVEVFDVRELHGCLVGVLSPIPESKTQDADGAAGKRYTSRINATGQTTWSSDAYLELLGRGPEDSTHSALDWVHPDDQELAMTSFIELLSRPGGKKLNRLRIKHAGGWWVWLEFTNTNLLHTDDPHVWVEASDISKEITIYEAFREREALLQLLTETLPVGVLHLEPGGEPGVVNSTWSALTGLEAKAGAKGLLEAMSEPDGVRSAIEAARTETTDLGFDVSFLDQSAPCRYARLRIRSLPGNEGARGILLTLTDTTESEMFQSQLREQSRTDHLTGVLNRLGFEEQLREMLAELPSDSRTLSLIYIDLDDFKHVNDSFGHATGDDLLVILANRISEQLRESDLVARLGGDEFAAVVRDTSQKGAQAIVDRIRRGLAEDSRRMEHSIEMSASFGVAVAEPGDSTESLISRADTAMYEEKTARHAASRSHLS